MVSQLSADEAEELPPLDILLAEDDEINQRVAIAFLQRGGHRVTVVADGRQAVEAAAAGHFDLILMDIRMPGMDGVEATRRIRGSENRRQARIPIFALTANYTTSEVETYLEAGLNGVIGKPLVLGHIERMLMPLFGIPRPPPPTVAPDDDVPVLDHQRLAVLAEALDAGVMDQLREAARGSIANTAAELRRRWEEGDSPAATKAAHRIAGVAANFGCVALAALARRIELDGQNGTSGQAHEAAFNELVGVSLEALSINR